MVIFFLFLLVISVLAESCQVFISLFTFSVITITRIHYSVRIQWISEDLHISSATLQTTISVRSANASARAQQHHYKLQFRIAAKNFLILFSLISINKNHFLFFQNHGPLEQSNPGWWQCRFDWRTPDWNFWYKFDGSSDLQWPKGNFVRFFSISLGSVNFQRAQRRREISAAIAKIPELHDSKPFPFMTREEKVLESARKLTVLTKRMKEIIDPTDAAELYHLNKWVVSQNWN